MRRRTRFGGAAVAGLWYVLFVVVLPVTSLTVLGLVALWRDGHLLALLVGWLAVTLAGYAVFVNLPRRRARRDFDAAQAALAADAADGVASPDETSGDLPEQLAERPDWSERDSAVWQRRCAAIERALAQAREWEDFPELAAAELAAVAAEYHGPKANARLRFTLPEALLMLSVASERYRHLVNEHVPFADRITVASLATLHERQAQIRDGIVWLDRARRVLRLVNPAGALVGELRDQFTNRVLDETGATLQQDLKRLLLQEIAQVGIDLYSGRLKVSDRELARYRSRAVRADETRRPEAAEPLRVVLIGQVSAGKSSLVNALAETLAAEVDLLPTTDRTTVHVLRPADGGAETAQGLGGAGALHLVDTPGIDEDPERRRRLLAVASDADIILWVARATQPARAPDEVLHAQLAEWFDARPERRMPPVLLALTHIDRLPPRAEWSPPYDLERGTGKAATIRRALDSARDAIGLDPDTPAVPVCLAAPRGTSANASARAPAGAAAGAPVGAATGAADGATTGATDRATAGATDRATAGATDRATAGAADDASSGAYNVEAIAAQIVTLVDEATLAQFNRRRVERGGDTGGWRTRWRQTRTLGFAVGRTLVRRAEKAVREERTSGGSD